MKSTLPFIIITFTSICLVACNKGKSGVSDRNVARFVDRSAVVIPPTATASDFRSPFSPDGVMMLKLEMPAGDLAAFLSKSGLDGDLTNTTRESAAGYLGDFLPAHPKKFREGQKSLPDEEFLNVLVDEDSPTSVVVYLYWFGT